MKTQTNIYRPAQDIEDIPVCPLESTYLCQQTKYVGCRLSPDNLLESPQEGTRGALWSDTTIITSPPSTGLF